MTNEQKERMEANARDAVMNFMPYGLFVNKENGKVLFFNRKYEIIEWGGQREFDFKPEDVGIQYEYALDHRFLMAADGTEYVGKMYWLYSRFRPYSFIKEPMWRYFEVMGKLFPFMMNHVSNAWASEYSSQEQYDRTDALMKKYYPQLYSKK